MAECQRPEEESKVGAAAGSEESCHEVSHDQDVPKESILTSSPDTDSPVMINVDVSPRLKMLFIFTQLSDFTKTACYLL